MNFSQTRPGVSNRIPFEGEGFIFIGTVVLLVLLMVAPLNHSMTTLLLHTFAHFSSIHLVWRLISTLIKLEISTLLKTITNSCFQALEGLKFQALEGLKFQNNRTQKQMNRTKYSEISNNHTAHFILFLDFFLPT